MENRRKAAGFSLVEVLVVIAIITIFAAMLVLQTKGMIDRSKESSTKETLSNLAQAINQIKNDTSFYLWPFDWDNDTIGGDFIPFEDYFGVNRGAAFALRWNGPYVGYNKDNAKEFKGSTISIPGFRYPQEYPGDPTEYWPTDAWGMPIVFVAPGDDYFGTSNDSNGYLISFGIDKRPGAKKMWNTSGGGQDTDGKFEPWRGDKPNSTDHVDPAVPDIDDIIYRF